MLSILFPSFCPEMSICTFITLVLHACEDIEGYSELMKREPGSMGKGLRMHNCEEGGGGAQTCRAAAWEHR